MDYGKAKLLCYSTLYSCRFYEINIEFNNYSRIFFNHWLVFIVQPGLQT